MKNTSPPEWLNALSACVSETLGLHYPPERWSDLERGIQAASAELGFRSAEQFARSLSAAGRKAEHLVVLARHLTIGETYFLRDARVFELLERNIIPGILREGRSDERHLRIWSVACCSGEEPYSIAITVRRAVPAFAGWNVSILGSDVNPAFLQKAMKGVFSEWSFRNAPGWLKEHYFRKGSKGRWEISPEIKQMVSFFPLNLAEDYYPSVNNNTNALDVIFCRNVLIYFSPEQSVRVVEKLQRCLKEGGWLVVSPTEASLVKSPNLERVNFEGAILFRRQSEGRKRARATPRDEISRTTTWQDLPASTQAPVIPFPEEKFETFLPIEGETSASLQERAEQLYARGEYESAAALLEEHLRTAEGTTPELILLARVRANQGNLRDALRWADQAASRDKLNSAAQYLRASILSELGEVEEAMVGFRRTLYLEPDFVLAQFALGNLYRAQGRANLAETQFRNAMALLRQKAPEELLPNGEEITAGRLADLIRHTYEGQLNSEPRNQ